MKSILMSIQPKWCELIASGKKTFEVRKTKPKIDPPFKVYIYQTKKTWIYNIYSKIADWQRKVIGEFVCDEIYEHNWANYRGDYGTDEHFNSKLCLSYADLNKYGNRKNLYSWHISELKIYDKPKELSEFIKPCIYGEESEISCFLCDRSGYKSDMHIDCFNTIARPPQSWCYVEEV